MIRALSLGFAALLAVSASAWAAGDGGTDTTSSPTTHNCKKGEVWDKKAKKCVKASSGLLPDEELYPQGRALAKLGYYDWAVDVLSLAQNQDDPRVLNYLGYSNRKAGRLELGISYYGKALRIDPNYVLAREYLGEGYVAAGQLDLARAQLAEIEKRCGVTCEEYKDLSEAIATRNGTAVE